MEGTWWSSKLIKDIEPNAVCVHCAAHNLNLVLNDAVRECAPQTHQLALDMQLSILAGFLVWLATSKPTTSKVLVIIMQVGAVYSRYSVVLEHRLTMLIYHGVSVSQLYRTARLSYTSTLHRCTPYLMGVVLGLSLNKPSNISMVTSIFCWVAAGLLWGAVWWAGVDSGAVTHRYSSASAARYAALAPLAVASSLALFIYAVHNGRHGSISRALSSRPIMVISRLSYALYLCQFIVFLTNAATVRTSSEFTVLSMFNVQEISAIFLASIILTLTLVLPMQSLNNYIFRPESASVKESETGESVKEPTTSAKMEEEKKAMEASVARTRSIIAHREVLEEIPEAEVEYEFQRENRDEGLEGILEEEEDEEMGEEEYGHRLEDEDMEILEGEDPGGDDDYWAERQAEFASRRHYVSNDDQELDDWEWTNNNGRNGTQYWHSR
ncbi:hypothetical protein EVAR_42991_1 [Eumeta japonica]|uniref:Acyltransferase 3 domain-containing protein n=1 Tax=Eumeta variegata TaxID=151549 RepID=A0A4C1WB37_EUMVA|nr:hypothetical protein EVAR_42991_1 [Eumeta japonica]